MMNHYNVLSVSRTASADEIRKAYRNLANLWHPDKNLTQTEAATAQFKVLGEAYKVLSDPKLRSAYDKTIAGTVEVPEAEIITDEGAISNETKVSPYFNQQNTVYLASFGLSVLGFWLLKDASVAASVSKSLLGCFSGVAGLSTALLAVSEGLAEDVMGLLKLSRLFSRYANAAEEVKLSTTSYKYMFGKMPRGASNSYAQGHTYSTGSFSKTDHKKSDKPKTAFGTGESGYKPGADSSRFRKG